MKRGMKGSITVEAAFVMPLVFGVVFSIIYLTFYLYDIGRVEGVMDIALHKAGLTVKYIAYLETGERATEKEEIKVEAYLKEHLSHGLLLSSPENIQVWVGRHEIKAEITVKSKKPFSRISKVTLSNSYKTINRRNPIHNPAETLRVSRVILDTGNRIKGVRELLEKLKKNRDG